MAERRAPSPEVQFSSLRRQAHAGRLGMWIFLGSETLLFGALFGLYLAYRIIYGDAFVQGLSHNDQELGTLNTAILITSSFTVAMAISAVRADRTRLTTFMILATLILGGVFLFIKGYEYALHFHHGIYPGSYFDNAELDHPGMVMFFTLYFFMTGLHLAHVLGGMVALAVVLLIHLYKPFNARDHMPIELSGLYWHLVDGIWIFLWPLFYLLQ